MKNLKRRASFERYPELADRVQQRALAMGRKGVGRNFVLALKDLFEDELVNCFYGTYQALGYAPLMSREEMQAAISKWKVAKNGADIDLEALRSMVPAIPMPVLAASTVTQNSLTRWAEAVTENFLRREEVAREMANNLSAKNRFLRDIIHWIELGAHSLDTEKMLRQTYNDALAETYLANLEAARTNPVQIGSFKRMVAQWQNDHAGEVLGKAVLDKLFASAQENG